LKQYAASYQMLILSCHDHYNNIAGKKILLAEPSQKLTAVATP